MYFAEHTMMRRSAWCSPALAVVAHSCRTTSTKDYSGPIEGATGVDNRPGLYSEKVPDAYFEIAYPNNADKELPSRDRSFPGEQAGRVDNMKMPEFDTVWGKFENAPYHSGGPANHRYQKYVRKPADTEGVNIKDVIPNGALVDHHPHFDYTNKTGKKEGNTTNFVNTWANWDLHTAKFSLYRACIKSIPLAKHFYYLMNPIDQLKSQIRLRFLQNRHVKDPDAIRHLIHSGWTEYQEVVMGRRTRTSLQKFFSEDSNTEATLEIYTAAEGKGIEERRFWNGEEQRREGPYGGHWSKIGQQLEEEHNRLAGRIPRSWTASKGYFEKFKPDGTNYWEKNLDYEGWYMKPVDPDAHAARKDMQGNVESAYNQPKHYASKNRRGYRRMVKDIETAMQSSLEDMYTRSREQTFQYLIRENRLESNRVNAERQLSLLDDQFYSANFTEYEQMLKQVMREMPNPRLWKTDAFYFRLRYLTAPLEYNWARVPVGTQQEKLYNEWISDNANYAVTSHKLFEEIKADKRRNVMAQSFGDFYTAFDPDVPSTRALPWYHADFDYDRRYKWDERCMRMKKWVQSGTIDTKNDFFKSFVVEWENYVNRPERIKARDQQERRYTSARMVQMYRALGKLMDVALANQIKEAAASKLGTSVEALSKESVESIQKKLSSVDLSDFIFRVPTIIYPDGAVQPPLGLDGAPTGPVPTVSSGEGAPAASIAEPATAAEATA